MKKLLVGFMLISPVILFGQFGVKAGVNFANVTKASNINNSNRTGFHIGGFMAPQSKGIIGSRTELIFSRQGYDYKTSTNTGTVDLDYIMLPQFMSINITKFFSIHIGGQMAFLLNAKADSSNNGTSSGSSNIIDLYNKIDYGYGGGIEVHPVKGLLIGARLNISLGDLYKQPQPGQQPSFIPNIDVKNNVFQIFAGWAFGQKQEKRKKGGDD